MPVFRASELKQVVHDVFSRLGASGDEVGRLQEHLVESNLVGHDSHGMWLIPLYVDMIREQNIVLGAELDGEGRSTTDPDALNGPPPGSLVPLGGHKGYGLGLIVDILTGGLSGGGCSRADAERWGNATFMLAINPAAFGEGEAFETEVKNFLAYVRSSRVAPGFEEILIPGEPEVREKERRSKEGIFVEDKTWSKITTILDELKHGAKK